MDKEENTDWSSFNDDNSVTITDSEKTLHLLNEAPMAAGEQTPNPEAMLNELDLENVQPSQRDRLRQLLQEFTTV